jgi:hypothetical protein
MTAKKPLNRAVSRCISDVLDVSKKSNQTISGNISCEHSQKYCG